MKGPYANLKVLDLSHVIAGPFCARLLADMGAEVVRIEPRTGDLMRTFPVQYGETLSSAYAQYNCGKASMVVDLKTAEGRQIALDLVSQSDIVIENLSPGTFERLGLGYDVLRQVRSDIILCSLSTFGATGPYRELSGYGLVAEAYSGLMSLTGDAGGPPMHFGTPLADMNSAVHALAAIGAALYRRSVTGEGTHIDLSSFDALFSMIDQAVALASFSHGERSFGRYGTTHPTSVPSAVVGAADGRYVSYTAIGDKLFAALAEEMGRPELVNDPRFAKFVDRIANKDALYELIRVWACSVATADELVARLTARGISAAKVRTVEENLQDPHLLERGTLQPMQVPGVGEVAVQVAPYRMTGCRIAAGSLPAELGADTRRILRERLGRGETEISNLVARGIIMARDSEGSSGE
ncbi:CoA transferase [Sphingopyxis granuli]|uniref:CaiB/BaiF CoA transferase family protein n=1 Tax=Sphingopyxis granuli TaxID=267128 RepID=UPI001F52F97A|nr:CoA transferase [Sphingopyxis granuli]UNK80653.1 CoA transferase [Sphingopyxis granuli]